jgi:SAM-dependent methyltransferase
MTRVTTSGSGSGPGVRTRDGCSVELYRRLPPLGDIDHFERLLPRGGSVLELGCGAGRLTRELLARGHRVTAVDNSAEMLACVPERARCIEGDIETLRLGETFDAVLLASCLVNTTDDAMRARILRVCNDHLVASGIFVFERHDPEWLTRATPGRQGGAVDVVVFLERTTREGDNVGMTLRYRVGDQEWVHTFSARILVDAAIDEALHAAGFFPPQWLDERRRWAVTTRR